jgi:hypothetical protein
VDNPNLTTVFRCFLKAGVKFSRTDTNAVGQSFMQELRKLNPDYQPVKVEQREFNKQFVVNAFPTEFEPLLVSIIEEYKKEHNLPPYQKPAFKPRFQRSGPGGGPRRSGPNPNYRPREGQSGGYRPRDANAGEYRPRPRPRDDDRGTSGGYRPRDSSSGQGGYRPRDTNTGGGGYRPRDNNNPGYRPRPRPDNPQDGYRPRNENPGFRSRDDNARPGGYQRPEGNRDGNRYTPHRRSQDDSGLPRPSSDNFNRRPNEANDDDKPRRPRMPRDKPDTDGNAS